MPTAASAKVVPTVSKSDNIGEKKGFFLYSATLKQKEGIRLTKEYTVHMVSIGIHMTPNRSKEKKQ